MLRYYRKLRKLKRKWWEDMNWRYAGTNEQRDWYRKVTGLARNLPMKSKVHVKSGQGQFGAAVSTTNRFGDGTFRRWRLQMYYAKKMCVFEILWRLDNKGCLLHKCFCCNPDGPSGQCSFPTVRILEELSATVTTCGRKYGLWRLFLLAWGVSEFTQKLSLDSIYC